MWWFRKGSSRYEEPRYYSFGEAKTEQVRRKRMMRPPALYITYAKSVDKSYCGFPFAMLLGKKFIGFEFKNYKRAIEYTRRFRSEEAAQHQVERFNNYYNRKGTVAVFKYFKIEADETWEKARERWLKEYNSLEVREVDE